MPLNLAVPDIVGRRRHQVIRASPTHSRHSWLDSAIAAVHRLWFECLGLQMIQVSPLLPSLSKISKASVTLGDRVKQEKEERETERNIVTR